MEKLPPTAEVTHRILTTLGEAIERADAFRQTLIQLRTVLSDTKSSDATARVLQRASTFRAQAQISKATFHRWVKLGLPVLRRGRVVFVDPDDARGWLEQRSHRTNVGAQELVSKRALRHAKFVFKKGIKNAAD